MAGVITPSPKNSEAPKMPSVTNSTMRGTRRRRASAASAMIPPSPRLWTRMITPAYLTETTSVIDQKISETIP